MRDFDQLRAYIPPLVVVPGTETTDGVLGDKVPAGTNLGATYNIERDGWEVVVTDPGRIVGSTRATGAWYQMIGYHRTKIEWSPWAREQVAINPIGQDVAEGRNFAAFHTPWAANTIPSGTVPAWSGADFKVLDIWSSEEIEENMLENLAWNMDLPGAQASYPADTYAAQYYPRNNPETINHKLRFDQVISARYRQLVSSTNAPEAQYWGGQLVAIHDHQIGGNASMSESIHHARYVYAVVSNNGVNNIENPATSDAFNYLKVGFFLPSTIDTLTVGLEKIESDAEWATLARRGASR